MLTQKLVFSLQKWKLCVYTNVSLYFRQVFTSGGVVGSTNDLGTLKIATKYIYSVLFENIHLSLFPYIIIILLIYLHDQSISFFISLSYKSLHVNIHLFYIYICHIVIISSIHLSFFFYLEKWNLPSTFSFLTFLAFLAFFLLLEVVFLLTSLQPTSFSHSCKGSI